MIIIIVNDIIICIIIVSINIGSDVVIIVIVSMIANIGTSLGSDMMDRQLCHGVVMEIVVCAASRRFSL